MNSQHIMTEPIETMILEHLKRCQVELSVACDRDSEMLNRLGRLEIVLAGLRGDVAHFDEGRRRRAGSAYGPPGRVHGPHRAPSELAD
jgi:hypothetical protein